MLPPDDCSDDELLHQLRRAVHELPDAPQALQRAAIGLWPAAPNASLLTGAQALLTRVVAVLSFDSWAAPALAPGMRSLRSPTRQLLYSASGRDVDLRITPENQAFSLVGQVLGPDETGRVELACVDADAGADAGADADPVRLALLDELGEFRIDGLRPGFYSLTLHAGGQALQLPPFDVGEPPP